MLFDTNQKDSLFINYSCSDVIHAKCLKLKNLNISSLPSYTIVMYNVVVGIFYVNVPFFNQWSKIFVPIFNTQVICKCYILLERASRDESKKLSIDYSCSVGL